MTDSSKKTIEKNASGEYVFTPYGEFLSYFHAHLEVFKKFCRSKNYSSEKSDATVKKLKSYMAANTKNVDQYFEHIPKFAEILGVSAPELSQYLNKNFLETLPIVQDKFRKAEISKFQSSPMREFERVTEEILETTDYRFPEGFRFIQQGNLVVLENTVTGEIREPQGLMAGMTPPPPALIGADPVQAVQVPATKVLPEKPILEEIVALFGDDLTGKKLELQEHSEIVHPLAGKTSAHSDVQFDAEDMLDDIEDLDFEEPQSDEDEDSSYGELQRDQSNSAQSDGSTEPPPGVLDDLGDLLGFGGDSGSGSDENGDLSGMDLDELLVSEPVVEPAVESFTLQDYFAIVQNIQSYQAKQDTGGYQSWLEASEPIAKLTVNLRAYHLKEIKGEEVDWDQVCEKMESLVDWNSVSIHALLKKVQSFNWVRYALDRATGEIRKGSPEFLDLAKKAWPHIQKAFLFVPDYDMVSGQLKALLGKVAHDGHRKELVRILTLTLNFLKTKYPSDT